MNAQSEWHQGGVFDEAIIDTEMFGPQVVLFFFQQLIQPAELEGCILRLADAMIVAALSKGSWESRIMFKIS